MTDVVPPYNPFEHVVEALDRKFIAESASEVDAIEQEILTVESCAPGVLWDVATKHPNVEVRAFAAYIVAKVLIQNHPLVKAGVQEALEDEPVLNFPLLEAINREIDDED